MSGPDVVAEGVRRRLQDGEGLDVGLALRGVDAARGEGHLDLETGVPSGVLHSSGSAEHDEIRERDPLVAALGGVEVLLDALELLEDLAKLVGAVDRPVLLGRESHARAVGSASLVRSPEGRRRGPGGGDQLGHREPRREDRLLEFGRLLRPDQGVGHLGHRVLPDLWLAGHEGPESAGVGPHVAVGQLEPGLGEGLGELAGVLVEALGDRSVDGIEAQGQVGGEHRRGVGPRRVVGVGHGALTRAVLGLPLLGAGGAARQLPLEAEEVVEEVVAPLRRGGRPRALEARGDGVGPVAGAEGVPPTQSLLLQRGGLGFAADVGGRVSGAVGLAEAVAARDEGDGLFIVHGHAPEGLADVASRGQGVGIAVGSLGVHVDESHLHRAERVVELAVAPVALVAQPGGFRSPVGRLLGLPVVLSPTGEAEGLQPHRLECAVPREDHQVGPGDSLPVLLLHRPQQAARLVQVDVVGPAVEGGEALRPGPRAAAAVADAVGARAVPGHPDEEGTVVAVVRRPPLLRCRHHLEHVGLELLEVDAQEGLGVVEVLVEGVGLGGVLMQEFEIELLGPPLGVGSARSGEGVGSPFEGALFLRHVVLLVLRLGWGSRTPLTSCTTGEIRVSR